jgi:hypothetical protein
MAQLITLETALLQIPNAPVSAHPLISNLIVAASNVIEAKCNRTFAFGTYDELHGPIGPTQSLWVNNPPITEVTAVRNSLLPAIYIQNNDPSNQCQFATVSVSSTAVTLRKMFNNVLVTNQTFAYTDFPTFASLATGVNALGNGWVATLPQQFALWQTADLTTNQTGLSARNISLPLCVYWWYLWNFKLNKDIGEVFDFGGPVPGYQNYRVTYTGGYETIPQEIQQATAELVQLMYYGSQMDFNMLSETQDKYTYTRAAENSFNLLSLGSKYAVAQYVVHRFTRNGVPAQE